MTRPAAADRRDSPHELACATSIRVRELLNAGEPTEPDPSLLHNIASTIHEHCGHPLLKAHRIAWGWTPKEATAALDAMSDQHQLPKRGITQRSWHQWEAGTYRPDDDYLDRLSRLFHANVIQLGYAIDYTPTALWQPTSGARARRRADPRYRGQDADPALALHWTQLLRILSASHNLFGSTHIHDTVCHESGLIRRHRRAASGQEAKRLVAVEARWAEFAAWTADNSGDTIAAAFWLDYALTLAKESEEAPLVAYITMRQAQQAADRHDGARASALAASAQSAMPLSDLDRALCSIRCAEGHALGGDRIGFAAAMKTANQLVSRAAARGGVNDDPDTIGTHCTIAYVRAHEGYGLMRLGDLAAAVIAFEEVLDAWPADYRQDEALVRSWLATSHAYRNDLASAGAEGCRALTLTTKTSSARAMRALGHMHAQLPAAGAPVEVTRFREMFSIAAGARRM